MNINEPDPDRIRVRGYDPWAAVQCCFAAVAVRLVGY